MFQLIRRPASSERIDQMVESLTFLISVLLSLWPWGSHFIFTSNFSFEQIMFSHFVKLLTFAVFELPEKVQVQFTYKVILLASTIKAQCFLFLNHLFVICFKEKKKKSQARSSLFLPTVCLASSPLRRKLGNQRRTIQLWELPWKPVFELLRK